jgi:hypothetical protein
VVISISERKYGMFGTIYQKRFSFYEEGRKRAKKNPLPFDLPVKTGGSL